jgi:hypothetical protein
MCANAVWVKTELLGEFLGACRALELAQQPEEPGSSCLREDVAVCDVRIHAHSFAHD